MNDPSIAAVVPDANDGKVTALRELRAKLATVGRAEPVAQPIQLVSGDPASTATRPDTPVLTDSGQRCAWQQDGMLTCREATWRPVSGGPVIDAALPRGEGELTAGTTDPASPARSRVETNAWTDCNAPANTEGCPNDFTYSPRPQTSGSQSFAVQTRVYPGGPTYYYDCYCQWVPGNGGSPSDGGYWRLVCYTYYVNWPAFTSGAAGWRSTCGTQTTTVAPNVTMPVSTLAFKASMLTPLRCRSVWCNGEV